MATLEKHTPAHAVGAIPGENRAHGWRQELWSWITTVDHKRIGILYGASSLFFFLVGGLDALLVRTQLAFPDNNFIDAELYNQMFTTHAVIMVFLALMPLSGAFFNFFVPLQIGARDVAFPRLNALSYWIYFFGGLMVLGGSLFKMAPNAGWFAYANLTTRPFSPAMHQDFYVLGLQVLGISSILSSINFIVTILNLRAPGMRLLRMPIFTWMTLITSVLMLTALMVLTIPVTQLMFDRFFGTAFYDTTKNADPLLWVHLFWMFGHPEVYILILPAFGAISEVIPTFSRKPLFGYNVFIFSGILIGWLGWGVWSHHMFGTGLGPIADSFFSLSTMLIAIPTGIKIFNWLATMYGGTIRFTTAMLFATALIPMFTIGGVSGIMHSIAPADLQQTDTYFVVAHIHYVFFGGSVLGLFSGIYYWYPKAMGRLLDERLGKIHFWTTLVAANITFFPMHLLGLHGMPRRVFTYPAGMGWDFWNPIETLGAYMLAGSTAVFVFNLIRSARHGEIAGPNPWGAATLEWATSSPPPEHNFDRIPVVGSRMPLWEYREEVRRDLPHGAAEEDTERVTLAGIDLGVEAVYPDTPSRMDLEEAEHIHIPPPSWRPIFVAFGVFLTFAGFLVDAALLAPAVDFPFVDDEKAGFLLRMGLPIIGFLMTFVGVFLWAFEPGYAAAHHNPEGDHSAPKAPGDADRKPEPAHGD